MPELMKGKRGLVMGVANDRSIAWGIARALAAEGAELAFSYQGEGFARRVEPLAQSLGSQILVDVDVMDDDKLDAAFTRLRDEWGRLDFLIHAIAYSDKAELTGRFIDTSRANFGKSLSISCYSLIDVARRARPLMSEGGSIVTLTYQGSNKVTPFYNVMGVAKAALESRGAVPRQRSRPRTHPGQRDQPRPDEDARRRRDRGRAPHLPTYRREHPAARQRDARRGGRDGRLPLLGAGQLHDRRDHPRRRRLSHPRHATAREPQGLARQRPVFPESRPTWPLFEEVEPTDASRQPQMLNRKDHQRANDERGQRRERFRRQHRSAFLRAESRPWSEARSPAEVRFRMRAIRYQARRGYRQSRGGPTRGPYGIVAPGAVARGRRVT